MKSPILSQTQNQNNWASWTCGALTCVTLFLLLRQTQTMCLFKSAAAGQKRWKWFLYSLCSSRNNDGQSDFASQFREKPLNKQSYGSVSISPVFCFSPHPPCFVPCPHRPPLSICRSRTGQTCWGKPWALGSWIHHGKAQPEDSSFLGHSRAQGPQGWSQRLGRCSGWWRG